MPTTEYPRQNVYNGKSDRCLPRYAWFPKADPAAIHVHKIFAQFPNPKHKQDRPALLVLLLDLRESAGSS